ncbi:MAG: sulfotransferase domain-containing protein [Actinomycetota bacterium]
MTRFVVLSTQRSGSTWVVDMLTSHPRVVAYSELFMHGGEGVPKWGLEQGLPYWQTFIREQRGGRVARPYLLWHYLGRVFEERPGIDAIGFKLMYSQLTRIAKPLMPALWLRRVRIVHLVRRNALEVVLSKEAGEARRGVLHAREGQPLESVRLKLRTDDLLERMTAHERAIEGARVRFKRVGLPYHEVVYEDLVADERSGFASLFDFLGVQPAPVSSSLQKVNATAHEELIENYGEVRAALEGTKFAGQLN